MRLCHLLGLAASAALLRASAAEGLVRREPGVEPALAPDPGVMRIINSLGEGASALLPPVKTTGDINAVARRWGLDKTGPCGRDYCIKMVWMPDRKRAIFCGANHAVPHRLNDVWEYDLPSNTWVCLYGPDKNKNHKEENWDDVTVDKNGVFRTRRGGPANVGHTWWQITYDPEKKALLWVCRWGIDPKFSKDLRKKMGARVHDPALWLFYPGERRWEPVVGSKFEGKKPRYQNASALEYLPELKGAVWIRSWSPEMSLYDSRTNTWKELRPNGGDREQFRANAPGAEQVAAYLPDRKMLVAHCTLRTKETGMRWQTGLGRTCHYDIEKNAWKEAVRGKDVPRGYDARTPFAYDPVGKVCLLWDFRFTKSLWAYDPGTARWSRVTPKGPPPPEGGRTIGYYDPERNVWVLNRRSKVWVYRHRRRRGRGRPARGD